MYILKKRIHDLIKARILMKTVKYSKKNYNWLAGLNV